MSKQINIGVIGVGHLGVHHASHLTKIGNANLVGIFDSDTQRAEEISNKLKVKSLPSGKLFDAEDISKLIFDINTKHKGLFNGGHLQIDQGVLSKLSTE